MSEGEQQHIPGFSDGPEHGPFVYNDPVPDSAVMYRVGGRLYPMRREPRCNTCQSPYRQQVERAVLQGMSYRRIVESLPEDAGLTVYNVREHVARQHLPLDEFVKRAVIEERAQELGRDIESFQTTLADHITFARLGLQKAFERLVEGEVKPDLEDGIAFAQLLHKVGLEEGSEADREAMEQAMLAYMEVLEEVLEEEQRERFSVLASRHPVLRALARRYDDGTRAEVVSVERSLPSGGE